MIRTNDITGTSLSGFLFTTYDKIVDTLGEPTLCDDKVQVLWGFRKNGIVITIYDYKNDLSPKNTTQWHIGSFSKDRTKCIEIIKKLFSNSKVMTSKEYYEEMMK